MMNIRPLEISDFETIGIEPAFAAVLREYIAQHGAQWARVGEIDGRAVFACGIMSPWAGMAEVWVRIFDSQTGEQESRRAGEANPHALAIIRACQGLLDTVCGDFNLHRLQAVVRADDARTLRFDEWMGFEREAVLKEFYADKVDAIVLRYRGEPQITPISQIQK